MDTITVVDLAVHVKKMRDLQQAYFEARKLTRWPDKKFLEASKAKEAEVDAIVDRIISPPAKGPNERAFNLLRSILNNDEN